MMNTSTASGFPEFEPLKERIHQHILSIITDTYNTYGFSKIDTPLVERTDNLLSKGGDNKEIYALKRVLDDDNDTSHSGMALRFDHTVPLALYLSRHQNDIKYPFLRSSIGPVFRGERAQKGRYRQFTQCDIDVIGYDNLPLAYDSYTIFTLYKTLKNIDAYYNIGDFTIRVNNRNVYNTLAEHYKIDAMKLIYVIDNCDKWDDNKRLEAIKELTDNDMYRDEIDVLARTGTLPNIQSSAITDAYKVIEMAKNMGVEGIIYDARIARGLDYYTGTVFEFTMNTDVIKGSICGGGRYDYLGKLFSGMNLPGVGGSIGITRLLHQLFDNDIIDTKQYTNKTLLLVQNDITSATNDIINTLKTHYNGYSIVPYYGTTKLSKAFEYAEKQGMQYVCIALEDELKDGIITIKDMNTREQGRVSIV